MVEYPVQARNAIIDYLNELLALDRPAVEFLINSRVSCNTPMADHAHVVCAMNDDNTFSVGSLGILNGILSILSIPKVAVSYDEATPYKIDAFVPYSPQVQTKING